MTARTVQIIQAFKFGFTFADRILYQPGTLEALTTEVDTIYDGRIIELEVNCTLRTFHELSIWVEDANSERFTLLYEQRLFPSTKNLSLLGILTGDKQIYISPETKLGASLSHPERLIEGDEITFLGFAEERGMQDLPPAQAPQVWGTTTTFTYNPDGSIASVTKVPSSP